MRSVIGFFSLFLVLLQGCMHFETRPESPGCNPEIRRLTEKDYRSILKAKLWKRSPLCPISPSELNVVKVPYYGFDGLMHCGRLLVHQKVAHEILDIFRELRQKKIAIESMDFLSRAPHLRKPSHNNTAAFSCRRIYGDRLYISQHSFGWAIDINPAQNPYVRHHFPVSKEARPFLNRSRHTQGMIRRGDAIYQAFTRRGWIWGGDWKTHKDYMHFEKPLTNGPVRVPWSFLSRDR